MCGGMRQVFFIRVGSVGRGFSSLAGIFLPPQEFLKSTDKKVFGDPSPHRRGSESRAFRRQHPGFSLYMHISGKGLDLGCLAD